MERTFNICMIIGIGIPLLSLILGQITNLLDGLFDGISSIFDGLNIHLSLDIGNASICFLPFSVQSICAGLLVFGAIGKMLLHKGLTFCLVVAIVLGYLVSVIVQTMIQKLKNIEHTTYSKEQLLLFDAKVINTIKAGKFGSISITTLDGITTNYPAKAKDPLVEIRQDRKVQVLFFEKNVAIVEVSEEDKMV